jgi:hypothetical protein
MKIILSRKGFDSTYGGVASPIFEDNSMMSIPIPAASLITYDQLCFPSQYGVSFGDFVENLHGKNGKRWRTENHFVHLDPDLNPEMYPRASVMSRLN